MSTALIMQSRASNQWLETVKKYLSEDKHITIVFVFFIVKN
jgi:hypothetical protein